MKMLLKRPVYLWYLEHLFLEYLDDLEVLEYLEKCQIIPEHLFLEYLEDLEYLEKYQMNLEYLILECLEVPGTH